MILQKMVAVAHFQGTFQNLLGVSVSLTLGFQRRPSHPVSPLAGWRACVHPLLSTQWARQRLLILEDTALLGSRGSRVTE